MAILSKGQTFASADEVTSTKLNNLVDAATFVSGASGTTDDSSLEVNGSGRLQVKDSGITAGKIAAGALTTAKFPNSTGSTDGVTYAKIQYVANMKVLGNVSGSSAAPSEVSILDEDTMSSDSATAIPTQQSVKAYVDAEVAGVITMGTETATTSGTTVDFTSIPSTVKRVTVILNSVSVSGSDNIVIRVGDSGGFYTTNYFGQCLYATSTTTQADKDLSGFTVYDPTPVASNSWFGTLVLTRVGTSHTWVGTGQFASNANSIYTSTCQIRTLSNALDRIRITSSAGAVTFDNGSAVVMYE